MVLLFVLIHKIGDTLANLTLRLLFEDLGFTNDEVAFYDVGIGFAALLAGVFAGGVMYERLGMKRSVLVSLVLMAVSNFSFAALAAEGYNRIPVVFETLADLDTPLSTYLKLAKGPYSYLLESAHGGEKWGRYSIIGLPCRTVITVRDHHVEVRTDSAVVESLDTADPLRFVEEFQARYEEWGAWIVAGAGFKRTALESFREVMAANMALTITINLIFAGCIAFGVVYNAARISLSESLTGVVAASTMLGSTRCAAAFWNTSHWPASALSSFWVPRPKVTVMNSGRGSGIGWCQRGTSTSSARTTPSDSGDCSANIAASI